MKHIFRGMLALIVVGVLIAGPVLAYTDRDQDRSGLIRRDIDMQINTLYGCKEVGIYKDSLNQSPSSATFTLPAVMDKFGYFLYVGWVDTVAAGANVTDSLFFRLVRKPDGYTATDSVSDVTDLDDWKTVYEFAPILPYGTNLPVSKHIPEDSSAVYPIGPGTYKWIIFGGGVETDHYARKGYKLAFIVEYDPKAGK